MSKIEQKLPKNARFSLFLGKIFANLGLFLPCFSDLQKIAYLCPPGGGEYGRNIHHCRGILRELLRRSRRSKMAKYAFFGRNPI